MTGGDEIHLSASAGRALAHDSSESGAAAARRIIDGPLRMLLVDAVRITHRRDAYRT